MLIRLCRAASTAWGQLSTMSRATMLSSETVSRNSSVSVSDYPVHHTSLPFSLSLPLSPSLPLSTVLLEKVKTLHSQNPQSGQLKALRPSLLRSAFTVGLLCKHFDVDSFMPASTQVC